MQRPVSLRSIVRASSLLAGVTVAIGVALAWNVFGQARSAAALGWMAGTTTLLVTGITPGLHQAMRRLAEQPMSEQRAENRRHAAIDHSSQCLCFFDGQQHLIVCNRRYGEIGLGSACLPVALLCIDLIEPIGEWVLNRAFDDAMIWPAQVGVAVNVSALFGVGFSSLSYLRSFPFDKIKIGRSMAATCRLPTTSRTKRCRVDAQAGPPSDAGQRGALTGRPIGAHRGPRNRGVGLDHGSVPAGNLQVLPA